MSETHFEPAWSMLHNPFQRISELADGIAIQVSGRRTDIREIVTGGQSAIILSGAPRIGKTTLMRYLQQSPAAEWSWRNELQDLRETYNLDDIHFVQIDLTPLEGIENVDDLLSPFVAQCTLALQSVHQDEETGYSGRKGLRDLLRRMTRERPNARFFVMLDTIERLQEPDMPSLKIISRAQNPQERGLALLDDCGAFRLLVDLLDEFRQFGVILSIESLPLPKISDQFTHVSADLARFGTLPLQTFTWNDTMQFLGQEPESFGANWADMFRKAGGNVLFSEAEQTWLYEQAGAHPYLLQQFCFQMFHLKREHAMRYGTWTELQKHDKDQLVERINERVSTFLDRTWKRVKKALDISSPETRSTFYKFIAQVKHRHAIEEIEPEIWDQLGSEVRYILYGEGIVRYDPLRPVYYPGSVLLNYLSQKAQEYSGQAAFLPQPALSSRELLIMMPEKEPERLSLSELEYRLIRTLLEHPKRCSEEELMKAAWGRLIDRPVFTQRMHHLRKKLREAFEGEEIVENRYGGIYLLNHAEWLRLV